MLPEAAPILNTGVHATAQEVALLDVRKEVDFCVKAGCRVLGVVENMAGFACPHCGHTTDIFSSSTRRH